MISTAQKLFDHSRKALKPKFKFTALVRFIEFSYRFETQKCLEAASEAFDAAQSLRSKEKMVRARKWQASCHRFLHHYDKALEDYQSAIEWATESGDVNETISMKIRMAEIYSVVGRNEQALSLATECLTRATAEEHLLLKASANYVMGSIHLSLGEFALCKSHYLAAIAIHEQTNSTIPLVGSCTALCSVLTQTGENAQAIEYGSKALDIADRIDDVYMQGNCCHALGIAYLELGDFERSLDYHLRALTIAEKLNNAGNQATIANNIGEIHTRLRNYEQAILFQEKALGLCSKTGNRKTEAETLACLGQLHSIAGRKQRALRYYTASFEIATNMHNHDIAANALRFIAMSCHEKKQYKKAAQTYAKCIQLYERIGNILGVAETTRMLGENALHSKDYSRAIELIRHSLEQAEKADNIHLRYKAHESLALCYEKRGLTADIKHALFHLRQFVFLKDRFESADKQRMITEMQVRYDTDTHIRKQEKLERELQSKSKELAAMAIHLAEKNELLHKIGKRLKNSSVHKDAGSSRDLTAIANDLRVGALSESGWDSFAKQFNLVHSEFLTRLAKNHTDISSTEMKVCALLKLQLSTKEIANFLQVTPRAVDKHRNQIRKKMKLLATTNLPNYFARL